MGSASFRFQVGINLVSVLIRDQFDAGPKHGSSWCRSQAGIKLVSFPSWDQLGTGPKHG
ncbi:hypothetical protein SK128_016607 [Halocaridina rubra]|uniref:Uncharacterized protein n=1 Tax=Halocaridina rubra TaxID=373956 RepID=A0AAN8WM58_HALRR